MLNRIDRRSQLKCLQSCIEMLSKGASVLFFPEGTRSKDKVMADFKKGAFSVAVKAGAPVVPITLIGTGEQMQPAVCATLLCALYNSASIGFILGSWFVDGATSC